MPFEWDLVWASRGRCVGIVWAPCGSHVGNAWAPCGSHVGAMWEMRGFDHNTHRISDSEHVHQDPSAYQIIF